jgi:Uncharacterized homolog of gamma-carboxymuconolactone decarboxylase subunit
MTTVNLTDITQIFDNMFCDTRNMEISREDKEKAKEVLKKIELNYGFVPLINQILSERPDMFLPSVSFGKAVLEGKGDLDSKTRYLISLGAASALASEHCMEVQMEHAIDAGATRDEVLEALIIGSFMALTRSQSKALRKFQERFGERDEQQ